MKIKSVQFVKSATDPSHYPSESFPEVAFVGRSNVGKSSLINAIINRKRLAKTSSTPGRTRLINFFCVNDRLSFVDLPGYGYAKVPLAVKKNWGPMVEKYLTGREKLCLIIFILDIRREPSQDDFTLIQWLRHYNINTVFVLTKKDKISKSKANLQASKIKEILSIADEKLILFSAKTGEGKNSLWEVIGSAISWVS